MKRKVENPTRYLPMRCLLISYPGSLSHTPRDRNVSPRRWSVVAALDLVGDQVMDLSHCRI